MLPPPASWLHPTRLVAKKGGNIPGVSNESKYTKTYNEVAKACAQNECLMMVLIEQ